MPTVLVVEDEHVFRSLICDMLEMAGHTVLAAKSAPEAVRIVQQHSGDLDLLLTDVMMPGMRGPELVQTLRALRPGINVVLMSGYGNETLLQDPALADAPFIQKPFDNATLLAVVSLALRR